MENPFLEITVAWSLNSNLTNMLVKIITKPQTIFQQR